MSSKYVHVISHTHWDREWYMPYEKHHVRLVQLMDTLLDLLERDPEFRNFHLDGQTIMLDDYLQVRPEKREQITRYVQDGRLYVGPWYILQDEFLTSSEANLRNLLIGHRDAREYGTPAKIGYFPDSFGNMGQAPQILKQAGIHNAVFGRGVKPTGFNNSVSDALHYESPYSEMIWQGVDGSEVLGILFANWYHNGMEVPVDPEEACRYWEERLGNVERFASTPHLLLMNGCDHQPVQQDLSTALAVARDLYPDVEFVHSNFEEYIARVAQSVPDNLATVRGELRSQRTDGWGTLVNTASARVYIKQANQQCQVLLEKTAEPLAAFAHIEGVSYPHHLFNYAWRTLMQNHPHDSICGCSVDEVHQEMMTRFAKSKHVAEALIADSLRALSGKVDTSAFADTSDGVTKSVPFLVWNTSGWVRSGCVSIELEVAVQSIGNNPGEVAAELEAAPFLVGHVVDANGAKIRCETEDLGVQFGYTLPDDRFRQPYMARRIKISFHAEEIPVMGYRTYAWVPEALADDRGISTKSILTGERSMENEHLSVVIETNGSLTVTDKSSGHVYRDLGVFEDVGDIGNEYVFKQPDGEQARSTKDLAADIRVLSGNADQASFEIIHRWEVPASAEPMLQQEMNRMVHVPDRKSQRTEETVPMIIRSVVSLEQGSRAVKLSITYHNLARDHRLRALFPSDVLADRHYADSIFELAERDNNPAPEWVNPSNAQHQQAFAGVDNDNRGLMIANIGLNEYEVLRDGRNSIAVTLLRSVGQLGDWGVFLTPEAQCIGENTVELAILPYASRSQRHQAAALAYQFQIPWTVSQTDIHNGDLPSEHSWLSWTGESTAFSSLKVSEQSQHLIARWYNMEQHANADLQVEAPAGMSAYYKSNVLEEKVGEPVDITPGKIVSHSLHGAEIFTIGFVPQTN